MSKDLTNYLFIQRELVNVLDKLLTSSEPPSDAVQNYLYKLYLRQKQLLQKDNKRFIFKSKLDEIPLIEFKDDWFGQDNFEMAKLEWLGVRNAGLVESDNKIIASLLPSDEQVSIDIRNEAFHLHDFMEFSKKNRITLGDNYIEGPCFEESNFFIHGVRLPFQSTTSIRYEIFTKLFEAKEGWVRLRDLSNTYDKTTAYIRNIMVGLRLLIRKHNLSKRLDIQHSGEGGYRLIIHK